MKAAGNRGRQEDRGMGGEVDRERGEEGERLRGGELGIQSDSALFYAPERSDRVTCPDIFSHDRNKEIPRMHLCLM